ncbi:hypothetical protein [Streptomyces mirabilis]|uniref:HTH luxR-type domain-containing protein n=1 Tax=Streptomyces mirabilis TaxID=68239 RepID=A0A1I2NJH6_9ACTN|nr:hypothetical protein [Streptomyces mirabilis]SFG04044.1 hypothetical protein SAMN02787118_11517 [Streptomyces mirabilis]
MRSEDGEHDHVHKGGDTGALEELAQQAEAAIVRLRQSLATLPQQGFAVGGGQTLPDEEVQNFVGQVAGTASGPWLEMRSGAGLRPEVLKDLPALGAELFERGVELHMLCQHVARFDPELREELGLVEEQGGLVRTMETLPGWFLVLSDSLALVPAAEGEGVSVVNDPAMVGVLQSVFTDYWLRARPFSQGGWRGARLEDVSQEVNAVIIRMLCTGAKDELVAKRLGMSVRTLRRRIAHMLDGLGAASRFQAGFEVGRSLGDEATCDAERPLEDRFGASA